MKKYLILLLLFSNLGIWAQDLDAAKKAAAQYVGFLANGEYDKLLAAGDSTMQRKANKEMLDGLWTGLTMSNGSYKETLATRVTKAESNYVTVTAIQFEKRKIGFQLTLNNKFQIIGIFLVAAEEKHVVAPYVNTAKFYEVKINLQHKQYPTEGMLSLPKASAPVPVVIIVHGSGAIDMDCSIGPNKMYKDLAWGLAAQGIAVLRYNKRTFLHQQQLLADNKKGVKPFDVRNEYLEDLEASITILSKRKEIDKSQIYVMGHSEGGYLIPLFNQKFNKVAGFVSLAGTLRQIPELALEQMDYLIPDSLPENGKAQLLQLKQSAHNALAENISATMPDSSVMPPFPTNYWLYLKTYQPQQLALKINKPILVLQGARDYQVKVKDLELWKTTLANKPDASFKVYSKLNHLFFEGEGQSKPDEYMAAGNIPEYLISDLVYWIKAQGTRK